MKITLSPETVERIETALNHRDMSEVRLKIEHGAVVVLTVKVTKIG